MRSGQRKEVETEGRGSEERRSRLRKEAERRRSDLREEAQRNGKEVETEGRGCGLPRESPEVILVGNSEDV